MGPFLPLLLSLPLIFGREDLRYSVVPKQWGPMACGDAVALALLGEGAYRKNLVATTRSYGEALDLRELGLILEEGGIRASPLVLDIDDLGEVMDRGLIPLVVHYSRPSGHYALLFGRKNNLYELGDPARGFELLPERRFLSRWSGAALVLDPSNLAPGLVERAAAASNMASGRLGLLNEAAGQAQGQSGSATKAEDGFLGLGARIALPTVRNDFGLPIEARVDLRGVDCRLGLCLPISISRESAMASVGLPSLSASWFALRSDGLLSLSLDIFTIDLCDIPRGTRGQRNARAIFEYSRVLDPLMLSLGLGFEIVLPASENLNVTLDLAATEALSENVFLRFDARIRSALGAKKEALLLGSEVGFAVGVRGPSALFSFGLRDAEESRFLIVEGGGELGIEIGD